MMDLIESVATLIDVRDRDDLEITLASVMFELVSASELILWRVQDARGAPQFTERLYLSALRAPRAAAPSGQPLEEMSAELRAAYETRQYFYRGYGGEGCSRHVFPVLDGTDVVCLIEIERSPHLSKDQERLVLGLMRIYRSHLGILENNDTDELTGLSNRRPFDESFRRLANGVAGKPPRSGEAASAQAELAVVDIDFFKRINDSFGHPYGDEVLVLLARLMRGSFRDIDRIFRFGGEEFVVVLPGLDRKAAETALERFRVAVETFAFPQVGHVTVSIGVTTIRGGETGSDAFGRADEALYYAKRLGRNQLRRYETLVAEGSVDAKDRVSQDIEMF